LKLRIRQRPAESRRRDLDFKPKVHSTGPAAPQ
jgi:hypothetical protein